MSLSDSVNEALKSVNYPGFSRDIVSFGLVKGVSVANGSAGIDLELTSNNPKVASELKQSCEAAAISVEGVDRVMVQVKMPAAGQSRSAGAPTQAEAVQGISKIVAIASGKGGVGKSTCSVNLACSLSQNGLAVGLMDCDIYGPSVPLMMGVHEKPVVSSAQKMVPLSSHGVKLMSMGFLLPGDEPVIWRGPMIMRTIQQFVMDVDWGELDILLIDLPPGTGDAQLSLCQTVPMDGGVVVTTPQEASLGVVRKGIGMFKKVNVPILGIVENMSYFTAPNGDRVEIFGHGGGKREAQTQGTCFLGEVPIFTEIREGGDSGIPVVVSAPESAPAQAFSKVASTVRALLD